MNKRTGVFLILGLLVLSLSFSSASWFSDVWNEISGNTITGNVVASTCTSGTFVSGISHCDQYTVGGKTLDTNVCVCSGECGKCIACDGRTEGLTYCYKDDASCTAGCTTPSNPSIPDAPSVSTSVELTALHRWYSSSQGDHFYTKASTNIASLGYSYEGIEAYVYATQVQNTVPLYRWYSSSQGDHFYTTATTNLDASGYSYEGIEAYVYATQVQDTVPLYRLYHSGSKDHIYTVSGLDKINLNLSEGWINEGVAAYVFADCSRICEGSFRFKDNTRLKTPSLTSFPISINLGVPAQINLFSDIASGNYGYEFWWEYRFSNGDVEEFCACDFSNQQSLSNGDLKLFSGFLNNPSYSFNLNVSNQMGRVLSNVSFRVASRNSTSMSNWSNFRTIVVSNPGCPANPPCDEVGENTSVISYNNKYKTCVLVNGCFNWSSEQTCPTSYLFDSSTGRCVASGITNTCNGASSDGKPLFCFTNTSIGVPFGSHMELGNCVNNYQICIACNAGHSWDSVQKECTIDGCTNNCTGVCSGANIPNSIINTNSTCCSSKSCYACSVGYHPNNGSCVSDICSGVKPVENSPNVSFGVNSTNISSINMTWNYIRGVAGACQWNCSPDYKINVSNNLSCMYGRVNCSEINGICSSATLSNAGVDSNADCISGSCFVCNEGQRYFSNGTSCVFNNSCASGYVWNGFICSSSIPCASNCILDGKCIVSDPNRIVRANLNASGDIIKVYCDPSSNIFVRLLADNQTCSFNAQCASNLCGSDLKCLNIAQEVRNASGWLKKVYCWFSTGFSFNSAAYNACLAAP